MLQLGTRPDRTHQTVPGVRIRAEEQMPYFVRDGKSKHRREICAGPRGQPLDAIDEHRRQGPLTGLRVDEGVPELKQPVSIRLRRKSHEPDGNLITRDRRLTSGGGRTSSADHP